MEALVAIRHEDDPEVRRAAVRGLRHASDDASDRKLLSEDFRDKPLARAVDPQQAIDDERVEEAAAELELPRAEVRRRYESWAARSHGLLRLAWSAED